MKHTAFNILFIITISTLSFDLIAKDTFLWNRFSALKEFYNTDEALRIANNIIALQRSHGGWGKKINPQIEYSYKQLTALANNEKKLEALYDNKDYKYYSHKSATFDNGATHSHIRFLLRVAREQPSEEIISTLIKSLKFILKAQYKSGGWPQNYPNLSSYGAHITFNDGAMIGVLRALKDVIDGQDSFITERLRSKIGRSFDQGVAFIIQSQVKSNGRLSAWAQQYHFRHHYPVQARAYELPAISTLESSGIVKLLMSIDAPNTDTQRAISSAIVWFNDVKILNAEVIKKKNLQKQAYKVWLKENPDDDSGRMHTFSPKGYDKHIQNNNQAEPIWARFYDINTNKPIFFDWDGKKYKNLSDLSYEARVSYRWYGYWPKTILSRQYPKWLKRVEP